MLGKILMESAISGSKVAIPAHFTRSFLAQVLGFRCGYSYFETDDPELYERKIKYILENNVADMELTFSEEVVGPNGKVVEIDLVPNGRNVPVTEENKVDFLNKLAHFRLCESVKAEVQLFIKGLEELVPMDCLTLLDEQELELLICGLSDYSVSDMKKHCTIVEMSEKEKATTLEYFWAIVASFTSEERARLLQFITGSSNLPTGGFENLTPKLQIGVCQSSLPMSHTCFNMINLPSGQSYEELHHGLLIAINFASEGFGIR